MAYTRDDFNLYDGLESGDVPGDIGPTIVDLADILTAAAAVVGRRNPAAERRP